MLLVLAVYVQDHMSFHFETRVECNLFLNSKTISSLSLLTRIIIYNQNIKQFAQSRIIPNKISSSVKVGYKHYLGEDKQFYTSSLTNFGSNRQL